MSSALCCAIWVIFIQLKPRSHMAMEIGRTDSCWFKSSSYTPASNALPFFSILYWWTIATVSCYNFTDLHSSITSWSPNNISVSADIGHWSFCKTIALCILEPVSTNWAVKLSTKPWTNFALNSHNFLLYASAVGFSSTSRKREFWGNSSQNSKVLLPLSVFLALCVLIAVTICASAIMTKASLVWKYKESDLMSLSVSLMIAS